MANELLYVPGVGTRYYYNPTTAGTVTLTEMGSGTLTSALENGRPVMTFGGKALKFSIGNGMQNSRTIEYWMTLSGWNNTGTSHQWGYFGTYPNFVKWLPKPVTGTNNITLQLAFPDSPSEDTVVTLPDQTSPVHVAQVFDTSDSSYQLKLYINGTKVKEHYLHSPWTNVILIGGSITAGSDTALTDVFTGKISDFLVTDGVKYTENFTPARPKVDLKNLAKGGNPLENFTAPEIEYLDVDSIVYKLAGSGSAAEEDNVSITKNASNKLQTVGTIDQNNTTKAIKTWTGTKIQFDAIVTKDADTIYDITDDTVPADFANTSLSNLTNAGKIVGAGLGVPSRIYNALSMPASGSIITAPADGWFWLGGTSDNISENTKVVMRRSSDRFGVSFGTQGTSSTGGWTGGILPVKKGDTVVLFYSNITADHAFRFFYAEGSKSEANQ